MTTTQMETTQPEHELEHAEAGVDAGFEQRVVEAIRPIAEYYLASCLHHLFASGVFDYLADTEQPVPVATVASALGLDTDRLLGLLLFLANEGVVTIENSTVLDNSTVLENSTVGDSAVVLTSKGRGYEEVRGWYTMMIGGYGTTMTLLGQTMAAGAPPTQVREGRFVGLGSCQVSRYDGLPVTRTLLDRAGISAKEILDLGCGNGIYLVDLCQQMPGVRAWGAEPDFGGYSEAVEYVKHAGMSERIQLRNCTANEFLAEPPAGCNPDVIVFGFVLHEILAQRDATAVRDLLRSVAKAFPQINIVVIEVSPEAGNPRLMQHPMARNFWNPYLLLHTFTEQRLEHREFWEALFADAGLRIADLITTDPAVDSSGLELGYLLKPAGQDTA
jgi:2-ketoarginine methyltransferase